MTDEIVANTKPQTAAQHASRNVPYVASTLTASDIRQYLQGRRFDSAADIAVCEGGRLVGLIRMEDLLAADDQAVASDLMDSDPPVVPPGADQEVAAWKAVRHGESSLAVVDGDGTFIGLIPPPSLIEIFLHEHDEDMARLGGYLRGTSAARSASEEPIFRRLWHRLPWLVIGLAGAVGTAEVVGGFEATLESQLALAFFLPGVVYLADAVGTQTETVVVRGLSLGVSMHGVARRETFTGLLAGLILGLLFFPAGLLLWGETTVAFTVAIALVAACLIATVIGVALPWVLRRFGSDPAFGTGPLSTVMQDFFSIVTYLSIASLLVD